ncbi:hypothetical protein MNBD_PLANCTO03-277 [hydrothermal vent metagenome]|uniref:TRASH domain-containing protein n=1 Tax=hydrothermal vent metagenome TaxID=652676 RepID=A0A3B1D286_9ZZZZ
MSMSPIRSMFAVAGLCVCTAAAAAQHDGHKAHAPQAATPHTAEAVPYMADTCPISGQPLGSMGAPVVREYDGREVRFCCKSCIKKFENAGKDGWKKLDAIMIEDQLPFYPVSTCLVSGEPLVEDGEDIAVDRIYNGRLVRFCCKSCVKDFLKNPEPTMMMLDAAVIAQQGKHYPLKTCVVSGEELGGMGEPYELVVGNRLVRLCCDGCEKKLLADPVKYLEPLNAAWEAQGMPAMLTKAPAIKGHEMMDSPMKDMKKKKSGHDDHADHDH